MTFESLIQVVAVVGLCVVFYELARGRNTRATVAAAGLFVVTAVLCFVHRW